VRKGKFHLKTIDDFLVAMREDREMHNLITNSYALKRNYKPRRQRNSKSGLAMKYLWGSIDGIKLMYMLERKYKVNMDNTKQVGKIKTALHLFIGEVMPHEVHTT
jgi:hypothetical protein